VGEIQQKILNHFFNCSYDSETVSQLSRTPAIFKSLKNKYLAKDKKFFSGSKKLFVTDNGAAAAVVLGITFDKLQDYFKKLGSETTSAAEQIGYVEKLKGIFRILPCVFFYNRKLPSKCYYLYGKLPLFCFSFVVFMSWFVKRTFKNTQYHNLSHNLLEAVITLTR
jgi:hypothetical protein